MGGGAGHTAGSLPLEVSGPVVTSRKAAQAHSTFYTRQVHTQINVHSALSVSLLAQSQLFLTNSSEVTDTVRR